MNESVQHLKKHPKFAPLVKKYGEPDLRRGRDSFSALCRSIIYQQITGKAAFTILARFMVLVGKKLTPERVKSLSPIEMRSVGLSAQKASYLRDLAEKFSDGTINSRALSSMNSEEVITHLTQVKGIGVWTVHMFLIFTLNRPDVLPTGDLGIQKGFKIVYGLKKLPTPAHMEKLAREWRGHASYASWYLWRVADEAKIKH
jgi:DNA-3-methyladenine glycosylase II